MFVCFFDTGGAISNSISVHRATLKSDLIQVFSSPDLMDVKVSVTVIDHQGRPELGDGQGVLRDVLASFWQEVFSSLTQGDIEKVPSIRHDHQQQEWTAVGRVLLYGFRHLGYVPVCLSPVFLSSCIHGEETITEDDLLESFKWYITSDEREVFEQCMTGQPLDFGCNDDLMEFLSSYRCYKNPTAQTIRRILTELAHQELIQKPRYVATCWGPVLGVLKDHSNFANVEGIRKLFLNSKPTAKKGIKDLHANPTTDAERESLSFLKKFIKSLDAVSLKVFLKFLTGSDILVVNTISVTFTSLDGMARTPVAHTCGPSLELPSTYQSYNELSEELTNILRDKESWTFNIV